MPSTSLVKVREQLAHARSRLTKVKAMQHARRGFRVLGDAAVIGGTGFLAGLAQGRYGAIKIPHTQVPVDLTLAFGFYVAGMFEPFGDGASHQMFNFGHGLVTSHLVAMGRGMGKKMRAKAGKPPLMEGRADSELSAMLEGLSDGGGTLSDDDLVRLATGI